MSFTFGKYRGKTFQEVSKTDPSYCSWFINTLGDKHPEIVSQLSQLVDVSSIYLNFGKHKNKTLKEIKKNDPAYIQFLIDSDYVKEKRPDILNELQSVL